MMRPAAYSCAAGIIVGACAAFSTQPATVQPQHASAGWDATYTGLLCWGSDAPIPSEFGGMTVVAVDAVRRRYILERRGRAVLIGEIAPGISCVLSEGAET